MNPLAELKDIHAAPDPGFWPLAPGWWVLLVLLIVTVTGAVYLFRWLRRRRRQRAVMHAFEAAFVSYQSNPDGSRLAADLHQLIRRLMLARGQHRQLGLTGEAFLQYLDSECDGQPFSNGPGRALLDAPYRPAATLDAQSLYAAVLNWAQQQVKATGPQAI